MKAARLMVPSILAAVLSVATATSGNAATSTTYQAETSNNTSTCVLGSAPSPSDCAATFAGQTDTRSGIETPQFDPPAGNVSTDNIRNLLYPGSTTKVFVNIMQAFCTPADSTSSSTVPRCNNNVLTQYTSDDLHTVNKQLEDFVRRGIDGGVMDWYGPGSGPNDTTLLFQSQIKNLGFCPLGPQQCQVMYLIMYDGATLKFPVTATGIPGTSGSACGTGLDASSADSCITERLRNDICYMNGYHFGNDAYQKFNGRPIVQFFIAESQWSNLANSTSSANWTDVWTKVRNWSNNLATNCSGGSASSLPYNVNNGAPLFIFRNSSGFTHTASDGSFGWVNPTTNQDDLRITKDGSGATVDDFYTAAVNNPTKLAWGEAYKGFNDIQSAWGSQRIIDQRCGQTWLQSVAAANGFYSSTNQLPFLQVATWNDYNEGTPIEMGIDNCYTVSASISGSTLSWQAVAHSSNASLSTIARWLVFDSTDGGSTYQQVASLPVSTTSYDLSGLPSGSNTLFVKMVGQPDIVNRSSSQLSFTH